MWPRYRTFSNIRLKGRRIHCLKTILCWRASSTDFILNVNERPEVWKYTRREGLILGDHPFFQDDIFCAEKHVLVDAQRGVTYFFDLPSRDYLKRR